jgi:hypothetical protein
MNRAMMRNIEKGQKEDLAKKVRQLNNQINDMKKAHKEDIANFKEDMDKLKSNLGDIFITELMPLAEEILRQNHKLKESSIEKFSTAYIQAVRDKLNEVATRKEDSKVEGD